VKISKYKIQNIHQGTGNRSHIIYAQIVNQHGEVIASADIDYICERIKELIQDENKEIESNKLTIDKIIDILKIRLYVLEQKERLHREDENCIRLQEIRSMLFEMTLLKEVQ